jgi:hypothetical protein
MSMKYILSTDGTIKKISQNVNDQITINTENNLDVLKEIIRPTDTDEITKPSEYIQNVSSELIFTNEIGNIFSDDLNNSGLNKFAIGRTNKLINKSFNFIDENLNTKSDEALNSETVKYYKTYNSIFNLELNDLTTSGQQIFANDLDFYGFSPEILKDASEAIEELQLRIVTILDITIAALIPILTISALQALIQTSQSEEDTNAFSGQSLELGKYISYSYVNTLNELGNFGIFILEKILNSIERIMNYPKFKSDFSISSFFDDFGYFLIGYFSYIFPGTKITFPNDFNSSTTITLLSNIITSVLTANSMRHQFNLFVRKVARNNYFMRQYLNSPSRQTDDDFVKSLTYLGSFFYRFIGERVAIGERLWRIDSPLLSNDSFGITRLRELDNNKTFIEDNNLKNNINLSSFRSTINQISGSDGYSNFNIWKKIDNNTNKLYETDTANKRIKRLSSQDVIDIEAMINSDYMPFSIHDVRTNEVFKFHAFIENVSDSFTPDFTTSSGFGRMDPVKIYNSTTRSISVDFWMVSTSEEDHNEMWYYINRLVTCLYPQWSKPLIANQQDINGSDTKIPFGRPFTQIPIASPLVRLRIGDLITSNYSRKKVKEEIFDIDAIKEKKLKISLYDFFKNIYNIINSNLKSIKSGPLVTILTNIEDDNENIKNINIPKEFAKFLYINFTIISKPLKEYTFDNFIKLDQEDLEKYNIASASSILKKYWFKIVIMSSIPKNSNTNIDSLFNFLPNEIHKKLNSDIDGYKNKLILEYENNNNSNVNKFLFEQKFNYDIKDLSNDSKTDLITRPNAIISSYEATKGEGIAGFINNLNLDFQSSVWDIKPGNIAPQMVKLTMQFNPIHDIPLGMNYKGGMRAVAYNVGKINRSYFKD